MSYNCRQLDLFISLDANFCIISAYRGKGLENVGKFTCCHVICHDLILDACLVSDLINETRGS